MALTTKSRSELKSYFLANNIPTQSNFAEFIDSVLNQREDGVIKLPDNPLSIQAANTADGTQPVLAFARDLTTPGSDWTVSLNARGSTPTNLRPGFSINDKTGSNRFFIDASTGNVGIGTNEPGGNVLNVQGLRIKLSLEKNGGGQLILGNSSPHDNKIIFFTLDKAGQNSASEVTFTGLNATRIPTMNLNANQVTIGGNLSAASAQITGDAFAGGLLSASAMLAHGELSVKGMLKAQADVSVTGSLAANGGLTVSGALSTNNTLTASGNIIPNAAIHFSNPDYTHSGIGHTLGHAAIENDKGSESLMVLGRSLTTNGSRTIRLFDNVHVNGKLFTPGAEVTNNMSIGGTLAVAGLLTANSTLTVTGALTANAGVTLKGAVTTNSSLTVGSTLTVTGALTANAGVTLKGAVTTNSSVAVGSTLTVGSTVSVTGNVGIGGTHPNAKLYVEGNSMIFSMASNGGGQFIIASNHNVNKVYLEALSPNGSTHAEELVLTGHSDTHLPKISLKANTVNVEGSLKVWGNVVNASDSRLKKDIAPLAYGLDDLRRLEPVSFNWKEYPNPQKTLGLIAQDVEKVISEVVFGEDYASGDSFLSIAYINLIPVLINAIKELDTQVQRLTSQQARG